MPSNPSIVGSVIERKSASPLTPKRPASTAKIGFPTVQHRSKSAFARNREEQRKPTMSRAKDVPFVLPSSRPIPPTVTANWREQMSKENEDRVASMDNEEREEERRQILKRFGNNIEGVLSVHDWHASDSQLESRQGYRQIHRKVNPNVSYLRGKDLTRDSQMNRTDRRLRFAELEPDDVYVYESAPPSPKRRILALPPPDPSSDENVTSLGQWKGKMVAQNTKPEPESESEPQLTTEQKLDGCAEHNEPEEGTAEYIRQRFFPDAPRGDPNLAWMEAEPSDTGGESSSSSLRFDLHGDPIPPSISLKLPTHLGLHHHAEGSHAGYTLNDVILLCRSTAPSQRTTMLGVLARITRRIARAGKAKVGGMDKVLGREEELRKRILAAGLGAFSERGGVGARAIEVVWECVVGWNPEFMTIEGLELQSPSDLAIDTLPLDCFLPQVATALSQGDTLPESADQLLSILHRLGQHNNIVAARIVSTAKLLSNVLQTLLLTPLPPQDSFPLPNPLALQLFDTLASSSRSNALEIEKFADSLLRFVAFLPHSSPYPPALATSLLTSTLRLYTTLASYGLYCHLAGNAVTQLAHLEQYIVSKDCNSYPLQTAWANLIQTWTICAIDPHQTTPAHDIRWSQIVSWAWNSGIWELQNNLSTEEKGWATWAASWRAQAAWLEGSKVNAIKAGEQETSDFVNIVKLCFEGGTAFQILSVVLDTLETGLNRYKNEDLAQLDVLAGCSSILASTIRLWLACLPSDFEGVPSSPPFTLPFSRMSELAARLLVHPLWSSTSTLARLPYRQISEFLAHYLRFSRRLPGVSESLWMAQALAILLRLGPGDEHSATSTIRTASKLIGPSWAAGRNIAVSPKIWEQGGISVLEPFLINMVLPNDEVHIGPLTPTPQSIRSATTQRLPTSQGRLGLGLPLFRDWELSPLDHLLRSGDSAVFKSLPPSWNASETEITRASLFLAKVVQETLLDFSLTPFVLSQDDAIFGCMKVMMLEHGQPQNDSSEEVFRDTVVEDLMKSLLDPYAFGSYRMPAPTAEDDLETVAARYLGPSVPFFQFYTDLVALYDAISFSHPLFAKLLLTPISMRYAQDYRKHLWTDFHHVVRTIRTPAEEVLSADIREYLYPIETDSQIIAAYLSSLLKNSAHEFLWLVALHHVSSNIWPDLQGSPSEQNRAITLLKVLAEKGSNDLVRIAMDEEFLDRVMGADEGVGKVDDFIGQLWKLWKQLRDAGLTQPLHLGLFRSDYLLHYALNDSLSIKQVEFNTISVSFGSLSQKIAELHRYLLAATRYYDASPYLKLDNFPPNDTITGLASGLAQAHKAYGMDEYFLSFSQASVMFLIKGHWNMNFWKSIQSELYAKLSTNCLYLQISTVYYRSGYMPHEYPTASHYTTRFHLERSKAIKCPTIALQLAGGKKVQEVLTHPGVLEHFLANEEKYGRDTLSAEDINDVRKTFMGMWGLDVGEGLQNPDYDAMKAGHEEYGVRQAREATSSLVLKPQREGGGNNVYKEDIPPFLDTLPPQERSAWIAMELIQPPENFGNYLIRAGTDLDSRTPVKVDVVSELGIFGWALFGGPDKQVVEREVGWLVRTKGKESNEGGVATGFSVLDSLLLVD
ncbi:hypothetical protein NLJ89_g32 [Agrocybe chaxingu]|uniref:Glutathione synthase n=1 Tax=Agrocybe chaxingu TaxID=84603 RepID=A0A9W8N2Q3_9AGAR|nr:hypothetical protein NLJ89_g32 [Agrocybe chaxingu]